MNYAIESGEIDRYSIGVVYQSIASNSAGRIQHATSATHMSTHKTEMLAAPSPAACGHERSKRYKHHFGVCGETLAAEFVVVELSYDDW